MIDHLVLITAMATGIVVGPIDPTKSFAVKILRYSQPVLRKCGAAWGVGSGYNLAVYDDLGLDQ